MDKSTEKRINIIEKYAEKKEKEKQEKDKKQAKEYFELEHKIKSLAPRIQTLLLLVNTCIQNGIEPFIESKKYTGQNILNATNTEDEVGFSELSHILSCRRYSQIKYIELTFKNSGNTMIVDSNADIIYDCRYKTEQRLQPTLNEIKEFLTKFNSFENLFLKYIDDMEKES